MINVFTRKEDNKLEITVGGDLVDIQRELAAIIGTVYSGSIEIFTEDKNVQRPALLAKDYISSAVNMAFEYGRIDAAGVDNAKIDITKN